MQSVFSAASQRTNSQGEKKGPGRHGALKTAWTKPWHGAASYGDRMAPVMVSRALERVEAGGSAARTAIMECAGLALCRCRGTTSARSVGGRFGSDSPPVAWSCQAGLSEAFGASAGVMKCRGSGGMVWRG